MRTMPLRLANMGMSGDRRASREEMEKVNTHQDTPAPKAEPKSNELSAAKKRVFDYVTEKRAGMDGDMSNKDWIIKAALLWLGKKTMDTMNELESLEAHIVDGYFDWQTAEVRGEI